MVSPRPWGRRSNVVSAGAGGAEGPAASAARRLRRWLRHLWRHSLAERTARSRTRGAPRELVVLLSQWPRRRATTRSLSEPLFCPFGGGDREDLLSGSVARTVPA